MHIPFIKSTGPCRRLLVGWLLALSSLAGAEVLSEDGVEIVYEARDEAVARESLRIVLKAREEMAPRLADSGEPIRIHIASTHAEFQRAAGPGTAPGVGAIARPHAGEIVIRAPRIQRPDADYRGILRHELVHVLLARHYNAPAIPRWLNEGIAMVVSGERRWADTFNIAWMYMRGRLIDYGALPLALEVSGADGRMGEAYAQSLAMTEYLMDRLGEEGFWRLLRRLDDMSFPEALKAEAGMTVEDLWNGWVGSMRWVAVSVSLMSGFTAFQIMIVLTLLAFWRIRRRNRERLRRWEEEEDGDDLPFLFAHELEGLEPPHPWEEEDEDRL